MKKATRYNDFLLDLIRRYSVGGQALDHGAGAGTFATPLSHDEMNVLCMEPDNDLRAELAQSGLDVAASLEEIATCSVDYAYSLNVLEHIKNDREAILDLYRCLKPGGRLLLYVPAFQVLYSQMDHHVGHFRRYRRKPLMQLLQTAGFEVSRAFYVDSLGFLATLVYKLVGDRSGSVSSRSVALYDSAVFPLSRIIDFLGVGSFGKNLAIVATKPSGSTG
jgi:SAM-dependent methyltransferase